MKTSYLTPAIICALFVITLTNYLAYQWTENAFHWENEATENLRKYQDAKEKTNIVLQKLATSNKAQLVATLQEMKPAIGIIKPDGNWLDISKPIPILKNLKLKVMVDSVLLARFPDDFRYEVRSNRIDRALFYGIGNARNKGSTIQIERVTPKTGDMICVYSEEIYHIKNNKTEKIRPANSIISISIK